MIEIESFIDLHTHTRYPDNNNFQADKLHLQLQNDIIGTNLGE